MGLPLFQLGWKPFFSEQVSLDEERGCKTVRVMSVHRGMVTVAGEDIHETISSNVPTPTGPEDRPTVGDWLVMGPDGNIVRILDRTSLFKRTAPGDGRRVQLIAANVDTLFVVTSCNQDFNVARLERYLVLAGEVGVRPVLVLTKADLAPNADEFVETALGLRSGLQVHLVNAHDPGSVAELTEYCGVGETVALVGSSGVGKSTLINTLNGSNDLATQPVRESDGKGLHTTIVREMHRLGRRGQGGGWLVDTPGMRELQMSDVTSGVGEVFADVIATTLDCRFTNCTHTDEPQCAVREAVAEGTLEPARLARWRKLTEEDAMNTVTGMRRRGRSGKTNGRK